MPEKDMIFLRVDEWRQTPSVEDLARSLAKELMDIESRMEFADSEKLAQELISGSSWGSSSREMIDAAVKVIAAMGGKPATEVRHIKW
jgi:hypothetical protein